MKIQIFIFTFNRPDFLETQVECLRKNIKNNNYEINVICNYRTPDYLDQFKLICKNNNLNFYEHNSPEGNYTPSYYHGECLNWTYQNIILTKHLEDCVLMLDHDMFLLEEFDILEYLNYYDFSGLLQSRSNVNYVWPGLLFLNMESLNRFELNFLPITINGITLDSGGGTYKLFDNFKFKPYEVVYPDLFEDVDLKNIESDYGFELHLEEKFLHYRNACFWNNQFEVSKNTKKDEVLNRVLTFFLK
jgi:hypothetical protein